MAGLNIPYSIDSVTSNDISDIL